MPEFRYIRLGEDINKAVSSEIKDDTWLIYPTERSCREAITAFQKHWQPLNAGFLSMDEFKQKVIYSNQIRLQDEKRLVCLFQAMTQEDREVFHIEKYPDLIDWGQHFFELFEELAEEEIDVKALLQRIGLNEVFCQEWQVQNYGRMLAILEQYRVFISSKGFTDAVFDQRIENLNLPEDIRRYVFVNQFYYSSLERSILQKLSERRLETVICYQGPKAWLDRDSLRSSEFILEEAFPEEVLPFKLLVTETANLWQMALAFLRDFDPEAETGQREHFIIDAGFLQQPYHKLFSRRHFRYAESGWMHRTRLYHFLQALSRGLENLVRVDGRLMVRLDWMLQAIGLEGFVSYFRPDWNSALLDAFTGFICRFADEDVLYLDLELKLLELPEHERSDPDNILLLKEIMALLKQLDRVKTASNLAEMIDSKSGISIAKLLSEEEKTCTTLQENFYTGLANFISMDELALVDDWQQLYPGMPLSSCIFALFLNFIRPRRFQISLQEDWQPSATVTNIMDTRNLQAGKLTFLNLTEGILPGARTPVWLFNEKQRREIGLKTWDDIRNWERHYFFRIIASAREVNVYTISNRDKDIELSSFLSELHEFYAGKVKPVEKIWKRLQFSADIGLRNMLAEDEANPLAKQVSVSDLSNPERQDAFFRIPFHPDADFGEHKSVSVSWSACEHLLYNPVLFLLQDIKRLRTRLVQMKETLNRRMFGNLLHHYLMVINQYLAEQHDGRLSMQWEWLSNDLLQEKLNHALSAPKLLYQLPANYHREFLAELLAPFLTDTAGKFFRRELNDRLDSKAEFITIIPELEDSTEQEKRYRRLMSAADTENGFSVNIKGRADLRLETADEILIIDFKTGSYHELQLIFYMWFYYLIDRPELEDRIRLYVYKLLEKKLAGINTSRKTTAQSLKTELKAALDLLLEAGYTHPDKIREYDPALGISRPDLLRNIIPEEDGE